LENLPGLQGMQSDSLSDARLFVNFPVGQKEQNVEFNLEKVFRGQSSQVLSTEKELMNLPDGHMMQSKGKIEAAIAVTAQTGQLKHMVDDCTPL
jgi:hypothetical protein